MSENEVDIVERLRTAYEVCHDFPDTACLMEAADEIEKLRHHNEEHQSLSGLQQLEIERLLAIIKRWSMQSVNGAHRTCNCIACETLLAEAMETRLDS